MGKKTKVLWIITVVLAVALAASALLYVFVFNKNSDDDREVIKGKDISISALNGKSTLEAMSIMEDNNSSIIGNLISNTYNSVTEFTADSINENQWFKTTLELNIDESKLGDVDSSASAVLEMLKNVEIYSGDVDGEKVYDAKLNVSGMCFDIYCYVSEGCIFLNVPIASEEWMVIDLNEVLAKSNLFTINSVNSDLKIEEIEKINESLSSEKLVAFFDKYEDIFFKAIKNVEKIENSEIEINEKSISATQFVYTINKEDFIDCCNAVIDEMLKDSELQNIFIDAGFVKDASEYNDVISSLKEELLSKEAEMDDSSIIINTWMDDNVNIIGREFILSKNENSFGYKKDISTNRTEFWIINDGNKILDGYTSISESGFTSNLDIVGDNNSTLNFSCEDFKLDENGINGNINIKVDEYSASLVCDTEGDDISYVLTVTENDNNLLDLVIKSTPCDAVEVAKHPSASECQDLTDSIMDRIN